MDEDSERKSFISRIGTFFLLVSVLILILFVASDMGNTTYFRYFFIGALLLFTGFILKRASSQPSKPGKRFEGIRKIQQKNRDAKAQKEAARNDPKKKK
jgi:hypothetical protein